MIFVYFLSHYYFFFLINKEFVTSFFQLFLNRILFFKINFNEYLSKQENQIKLNLTDEVISLIQNLSQGYKVEVNEEQSYQIRNLSILFDNEELYTKINQIFPNEINETNIENYLKDLQFYLIIKISSILLQVILVITKKNFVFNSFK